MISRNLKLEGQRHHIRKETYSSNSKHARAEKVVSRIISKMNILQYILRHPFPPLDAPGANKLALRHDPIYMWFEYIQVSTLIEYWRCTLGHPHLCRSWDGRRADSIPRKRLCGQRNGRGLGWGVVVCRAGRERNRISQVGQDFGYVKKARRGESYV